MGLGWSTPKSKSKSWAFDNRHQWIDGKAMYVMFSCAKKRRKHMWFSFRFPSPMFGGLCSSSLDPILGGGSFQRRNCKSLGVCKWITPRWNPNKNSFPIGQSAAEKVALSNPGLTHPCLSTRKRAGLQRSCLQPCTPRIP